MLKKIDFTIYLLKFGRFLQVKTFLIFYHKTIFNRQHKVSQAKNLKIYFLTLYTHIL